MRKVLPSLLIIYSVYQIPLNVTESWKRHKKMGKKAMSLAANLLSCRLIIQYMAAIEIIFLLPYDRPKEDLPGWNCRNMSKRSLFTSLLLYLGLE